MGSRGQRYRANNDTDPTALWSAADKAYVWFGKPYPIDHCRLPIVSMMRPVGDDDVVEHLSATVSDPAFSDSILPRIQSICSFGLYAT
jgi:hypothetical protein